MILQKSVSKTYLYCLSKLVERAKLGIVYEFKNQNSSVVNVIQKNKIKNFFREIFWPFLEMIGENRSRDRWIRSRDRDFLVVTLGNRTNHILHVIQKGAENLTITVKVNVKKKKKSFFSTSKSFNATKLFAPYWLDKLHR